MKIVVFDLDETLGYFTEFGIFWDCLNKYLNETSNLKLTQTDFNNILDLFPEFIRPNMINILMNLKNKKQTKCCEKMMIYTNNQGPKEWASQIISYFETKIEYKLFDQIIAAFKINGNIFEICRSCHEKTHKDLIKCTKLPKNCEICFLDDNFYPEMMSDNIFYINLKPYYFDLPFDMMVQKFIDSEIGNKIVKDKPDFEKNMISDFKMYNYNCIKKPISEYDIDKIVGKQIMNHIEFFFETKPSYKSKTNKTNKNKTNKNKTNKNKN
jgi:hypothetical protein